MPVEPRGTAGTHALKPLDVSPTTEENICHQQGENNGKKISAAAAVLAGGTLVLGALLTAGPASAATEEASAPPQACNLSLDTGRVDCFPLGTDVNAELERIYGIPVVSGANAADYKKNFDAAQQQVTGRAAGGNVAPQSLQIVLGTIYDDLNYGGGSWSLTGSTNSGAACGGLTWTTNNLPYWGWGGRVSSMQAASGCLMTGWEGTTAGSGASISTWGGLGYVGAALNDRINSLSWRG